MLPEIPEEQVRAAIERTAAEVLLQADILAPPVDVFELAERLSLVVACDGPAVETRARFARIGASAVAVQPTIFVADDPRPERRQWAVAHEIGESQAYRVFAELGIDPLAAPASAREGVANRLAGCLLLPRDWFASDGAGFDWDLYELKARYSTASHELIARRMLEMSPAVIITMADEGRVRWRRSNRSSRTPPLTPAERMIWQAAHVRGEATRCKERELPDRIEDARAWPVHEPHWRREIVRTALAEEW